MDVKPLSHVETLPELKFMCNGAAKQVSAGVAPCNIYFSAKSFNV